MNHLKDIVDGDLVIKKENIHYNIGIMNNIT